jgi:hypothetical protein
MSAYCLRNARGHFILKRHKVTTLTAIESLRAARRRHACHDILFQNSGKRPAHQSGGCLRLNCVPCGSIQSLVTSDVSPASPLLGLEPRHRIPNEKRRQPSCHRSHLIDAPVCKLLEGGLHGNYSSGVDLSWSFSSRTANQKHRQGIHQPNKMKPCPLYPVELRSAIGTLELQADHGYSR